MAVWVGALGVWLYGPPDTLTSLAVAGIVMTAGNSYAVCDIGYGSPMDSLSIELDSELLVQAEEVCAEMGITVEDAVVMFLQETRLEGRLHFEVPKDTDLLNTPQE